MVAVTAAFFSVWCGNPGFIQPVRLELSVPRPSATESVTEAKSYHTKQVNSVESNSELLQGAKEMAQAPVDSSLLATNPALPTLRDTGNTRGVESDGQGLKDEESSGSIPVQNQAQSENGSIDEESNNERVEVEPPEAEAGNPTSPIILPVRSEAKTINIETRFCVLCSMEQPLRSRHCRDCNHCVALYDHHCPWLGVCVAERNRFRFFWYLVAETVLLWYSLCVAGSVFESKPTAFLWLQENGLLVLFEAVVGVFSVLVTALTCFHVYLASSNLTTWECISWGKIHYLQVWPRNFGSPFSRGLLLNLTTYCCLPLPRPYTVWTLPQTLPTSAPRFCVCC